MSVEKHLIGACLLAPEMIRFASKHVGPDDFADARLGGVFGAMLAMRAETPQPPIDAMTVADRAERAGVMGIDFSTLYGYLTSMSSGASAEHYAQQVADASARRKLQATAAMLAASANNPQVPVTTTLNAALSDLKGVGEGQGGDVGPKRLGDILAVEDTYEWAIPGMLEKGDRLMITAGEGGGKSTLLRQTVVLASAGVHPLTFDPIDPVKCLVVDVENKERQWRRAVRNITAIADRIGTGNPYDIPVMTDMGINITLDSDLGKVHSWIDQYDPDVLMIGPLYKLVPGGIQGDKEASPVIAALDSIVRRGVALLLEGHAAKSTGHDGVRNLSPRGSAALMGWPEFGLGLHFDPQHPEKVQITKWRGDREQRDWPRELYRGGVFPWTPDTVSPQARQFIGQR